MRRTSPKKLPGRWRPYGAYRIRISYGRRDRAGWRATVYREEVRPGGTVNNPAIGVGHSVLGIYSTEDEAAAAAVAFIGLLDNRERLCTPAEIERVRREVRK